MQARLFTIISEFRGTTDVAQIPAPDAREAVLAWAKALRADRPFGRASSYLAKSVEANTVEYPPVAISGVANVWCVSGSCGGDFMLADIIETVGE